MPKAWQLNFVIITPWAMPKAWQLNLVYNECDVAWECDGADGADKSWQIYLCKQLPPLPSQSILASQPSTSHIFYIHMFVLFLNLQISSNM